MPNPTVKTIVDGQLDARLSGQDSTGRFGAVDYSALRDKVIGVLTQAKAGILTIETITPDQYKVYEEAAGKAIDLVLMLNSLAPATT